MIFAIYSFLDRFEYFDRWNQNDVSENANQGQTLIRELETVVRNSPTQHGVATIQMLNLLVPAVAIVQMVNGWGNVDNTTISVAYDVNQLFLNTTYPQYLSEHKVVRSNVMHLTIGIFSGFTLTQPRNNFNAVEKTYVSAAAAMDEIYRSVMNVQGDIARHLGRAMPKPSFFEGHHIAESGWIGYFNGSGAYCGFATPTHLGLAGKSIDAVRGRGVTIPTAYLSVPENHGLCKVGIPTGFFKAAGQHEIYWSNGENAYCYILSVDHITGPVSEYDFDIHSSTSFRKDGNCPGM